MSSFNPIERSIARLLSKAPFIKHLAKSVYSRLVYVRHKKTYRVQTTFPISCVESKAESFFGYYDKSPSNSSGLVLGHLSEYSTAVNPNADKVISLALFLPDLMEKLWSVNTSAYNWQQGARLHWLDDELFIYNDFDATKQCYVAKVVSSKCLEQVKQFDYPVQDSFGTDYFLALNYQRLMAMRPDYGYRNITPMNEAELKSLDSDGIWRVDFQTGDARLLVSLADMCLIAYKLEFEGALHKANHVMISPDGSRFIFLHRYFIGPRRFDRLMLANAVSGELKLLSDYGMVSHCFWADDKTILGYMRGPENKDSYWLVDVETTKFTRLPYLDSLGDGHPHVVGDWFVTDTYPDKARMQHLFLVNWKTGEKKKLGEFFHGFEYSGETRCDLHPRLSKDGNTVFFDSVFDGKRRLYKMELV